MCMTAASCQPYEPQQQRLLPDALQDGLPEECAGGDHDYSYNVQAAVDEAEWIVVVAERSCRRRQRVPAGAAGGGEGQPGPGHRPSVG